MAPPTKATRPQLRLLLDEKQLEIERLRGLLAQVTKLALTDSRIHLSSIASIASSASDIPTSPSPPPSTAPAAPPPLSAPKQPLARQRSLKHLAPLTAKEKAQLVKEGKDICFRCRETGHKSFDAVCPNNNWRALSKLTYTEPPAVQTVAQSAVYTSSETVSTANSWSPAVSKYSVANAQQYIAAEAAKAAANGYFKASDRLAANAEARASIDWSPAVKNSAISSTTPKATPTVNAAPSKPAPPTSDPVNMALLQKLKKSSADGKQRRRKVIEAADAETLLECFDHRSGLPVGARRTLNDAFEFFEKEDPAWFIQTCFTLMHSNRLDRVEADKRNRMRRR